ncbi:hypothetical protein [Acidocella sp.]|uniref:hypothetical protein n=1 Tax=Acidocella sp. TaxID=50710 RepID=UPI003D0821B2
MSEKVATAGFRNAGWTMGALPPGVQISIHPLATQDGAAVTGILYRSGGADTVFCIMHPREFLASHYLVPALVAAGFAVWTQTSRSVGQDMRLEHEFAVIDAAAGTGFLHAQGFKRIILIGNSGGASLYGLYNQQSLLAAERRLTRTPGGRSVPLATTQMPVADGMIFVSPHPGQGQLLMRCIDPAVQNEQNPLATIPDLDFLNPENGFQPGSKGSSYPAAFVERYRLAQRERVARLDALASKMIEERMEARKRAKAGGSLQDARLGAVSGLLTVWRTDADLRCWDLSLDPSERKLGSVWGKNPIDTNYGVPGFGRVCTPEAWLSTWSGLSSRADLFTTATNVEQPCLQIEYTGDNTVFPSDGEAIFAAIVSGAKVRARFRGDHHGRALEPEERPGRDDAAAEIVRWTREMWG